MRAWSALALLLVVGCRTTKLNESTETRTELPATRFVTVPRLARTLDLYYQGDLHGFIEPSAPPDHVMLVPDSRQAVVNGHEFAMEYPCVQRGRDYVLRRADAAMVTRTLRQLPVLSMISS